MNSPEWIQNSWPGQTRKFFETFSDVPWWTLSVVSAIRETNFQPWTVTTWPLGIRPQLGYLPTCRPRESTYAPSLLSRHQLRIGNLLANFVQCFVPFRRLRLPLILPEHSSNRTFLQKRPSLLQLFIESSANTPSDYLFFLQFAIYRTMNSD